MPFKTARSMVLILEKLFLMPAIPLVGCWPQRRFAAMQHDIGNREQTGRSADEARTTARDSSERVMWRLGGVNVAGRLYAAPGES
jgi:hypothetical protein